MTDSPQPRRPLILYVEDEEFYFEELPKILEVYGYDVIAAADPDSAVAAIDEQERIDCLLTDVQMALGPDPKLSRMLSRGGKLAGVALARRFLQKFPGRPVLFWTGTADAEVREAARGLDTCDIIRKTQSPEVVIEELRARLEGIDTGERPRIFIIHGHDQELLNDVRRYLVADLKLPAPTVLIKKPTDNRSIIERIELVAKNIDLVIALLTPDDLVSLPGRKKGYRQPRPNAVFELGYFLGLMGRCDGPLVILSKGEVKLPSDLHGILTIDVSDGLAAAEATIEHKVRRWLRRTGPVTPGG